MKKNFILFTIIFIFFGFFYAQDAKTASLSDLIPRLRGYILLQVEERGEAWYVNPTDDSRIYMKNGAVAYNVMSEFGLGITNADLEKIPVGIEDRFQCTDTDGDTLCDKLEEGLYTDIYDSDTDDDGYSDGTEVRNNYNPLSSDTKKKVYDQSLANRLKGRILLQVEERGQAWYINPRDGKRYYMTDGDAAYQIMRYLSLGITNGDLSLIPISDYKVDSLSLIGPVCGNGTIETGEDCDGSAPAGYNCNECQLVSEITSPVCGNGIIESGESCDGSAPAGYTCSQCQLVADSIGTGNPICGNGTIEIGEECDGSAPAGYTCSQCQLVSEITSPVCGNDIVESGEECDGSDSAPEGYICNRECQLIELRPIELSYNVSIPGAYQDNFVVASSNAPEGSSYRWQVNGQTVEAGTTPTIFLAHYDGNTITASGQTALSQTDVTYSSSIFGQAMSGRVDYPRVNNIDFSEGTLETWLYLKQPITSSVFDNDPYILSYRDSGTGDGFYLLVHDNNNIKLTMYDSSAGWTQAVQTGTNNYSLAVNQPIMISATWSASEGTAKFYLNGEQISRRDYTSGFPIIATGGTNLQIGNTNVLIDEFRILKKPLAADEIRENYKRGAPFSQNELIYSGSKSVGSTITASISTVEGWISSTATVKSDKINVTSPDGYFVDHTTSLGLSFSTPSTMTCRYGSSPALYDNLPYSAGTGTFHSINKSVSSSVEPVPIAIKCRDASGQADDYGFFRQYRILPELKTEYPKISRLWWGGNPSTSDIAFLSKFDLVNFDKSAILVPEVIKQLRQANPEAVVLLYKTAIAWQKFTSSVASMSLGDRINDSMRLQSSEQPGVYATNLRWPNNLIYNLYAPTGYTQKVAEHMEKDIFDRRHYFDGIWWDVVGPHFWFLRDDSGVFSDDCDFDLDGTDDDLNDTSVRLDIAELWREGIHQEMQYSFDRLGSNMLTIGNGFSPDHGDYNGKLWEETFNISNFSNYFDINNIDGFLYWQAHSREPRLNDDLFANTYSYGSANFYRYHRFGLGASLLAGIYYNPQPLNDNRNNWWFDEYWVDPVTLQPTTDRSRGSGYLGEAVGAAYIDDNGIWRRNFEKGIVIVNNTSLPVAVDLFGQFREIDGSQDPTINSGLTIEALDLAAYDGRVLLRSLCSDNPYEDPWCIAN